MKSEADGLRLGLEFPGQRTSQPTIAACGGQERPTFVGRKLGWTHGLLLALAQDIVNDIWTDELTRLGAHSNACVFIVNPRW